MVVSYDRKIMTNLNKEIKTLKKSLIIRGIYVFEALGFTYVVDLEKGDLVYFNPFRIERRNEKEI